MTRYVLNIAGTFTRADASTREFSYRQDFEAEDTADLKSQFEEFMALKSFKSGAVSFDGTVSAERVVKTSVAVDLPFSGTFSVTRSITIDFGV